MASYPPLIGTPAIVDEDLRRWLQAQGRPTGSAAAGVTSYDGVMGKDGDGDDSGFEPPPPPEAPPGPSGEKPGDKFEQHGPPPDCGPGMRARWVQDVSGEGQWICSPTPEITGPGDGGGGGGGGGFGPTGPAPVPSRRPVMTPTGSLLSGMSPEFIASITRIARFLEQQGASLFSVGMPAYVTALRYYQTLVGGSRGAMAQAIGPEAEMIAAGYRGAARQIEGPALRSGIAASALADLQRAQAGDIGQLIQRVRPQAAAALGALGQGGIQLGQAATGQALSPYQNLLGAAIQGEQFGAGLGFSYDQLSQNLYLGEQDLALRAQQLEQLAAQFSQEMDYRNRFFSWQQQQYADYLRMMRSQQQRSFWGGLFRTLLPIGLSFIPGFGPAAGAAAAGFLGGINPSGGAYGTGTYTGGGYTTNLPPYLPGRGY